jgi:hypothetical protein
MKAKSRKTPRKKAAVSTPAETSAQVRFQSDLVTRGEAAEPGPDGKLPRQATHAVIKKRDGTRAFKRDKFKLF